jgi:hypothetical protein
MPSQARQIKILNFELITSPCLLRSSGWTVSEAGRWKDSFRGEGRAVSRQRSTVSATELGRVEMGVRASGRSGTVDVEVGALGGGRFAGMEERVVEGIRNDVDPEVLGIRVVGLRGGDLVDGAPGVDCFLG